MIVSLAGAWVFFPHPRHVGFLDRRGSYSTYRKAERRQRENEWKKAHCRRLIQLTNDRNWTRFRQYGFRPPSC